MVSIGVAGGESGFSCFYFLGLFFPNEEALVKQKIMVQPFARHEPNIKFHFRDTDASRQEEFSSARLHKKGSELDCFCLLDVDTYAHQNRSVSELYVVLRFNEILLVFLLVPLKRLFILFFILKSLFTTPTALSQARISFKDRPCQQCAHSKQNSLNGYYRNSNAERYVC